MKIYAKIQHIKYSNQKSKIRHFDMHCEIYNNGKLGSEYKSKSRLKLFLRIYFNNHQYIVFIVNYDKNIFRIFILDF